jgi:hypothetical protein
MLEMLNLGLHFIKQFKSEERFYLKQKLVRRTSEGEQQQLMSEDAEDEVQEGRVQR